MPSPKLAFELVISSVTADVVTSTAMRSYDDRSYMAIDRAIASGVFGLLSQHRLHWRVIWNNTTTPILLARSDHSSYNSLCSGLKKTLDRLGVDEIVLKTIIDPVI